MAADVAYGFCPAGSEDGLGDYDDDDFDLGCGGFDKDCRVGFSLGAPEADILPPTPNSNFRAPLPELRKRSNSFGRRKRSPRRRDKQGSPLVVDDLRSAVIRGNLAEVQSYIDKGVPVDSILKTGWTALMYAASFGSADIVKLLLDRGADANFHKDRFTVLMSACTCNKENEAAILSCVSELIQHGAKVNCHDRYHMTCLMYVSRQGYQSLVRCLLDNGVDIDKQDVRGWTALTWAASRGHLHIVRTLLEFHADAKKLACDGQTPADIAYAQNYTAVADLLELATNPSQLGSKINHNSSEDASETTNISTIKKSSPAEKTHFVRYGELELFLCGLELAHLVPLFQEQEITFSTFLRLNDADLERMGIRQLGYRKKILEAIHHVHVTEWKPTSLTSNNLHLQKNISFGECNAMIRNIHDHCDYIGSTIYYIRQHVPSSRLTANNDKDTGILTTYSQQIAKTITKVGALQNELRLLEAEVKRVCNESGSDLPVDLIVNVPEDHYWLWRVIPWIGIGSCTIFGYYWIKRHL
ncbi:ankyrin repeat, SAM and basic leucine zipper domain-containing protein 1-like [Saccoglossus kowalevskii]|uniref:Ankyrin repeat, SAM and basic leucine zipper domain-containing protein 1 n=1 Tax=Saccoglossus kowalevskii TaxID=10224 RepID=A0ABM0M8Q4_SACKO|nr:PREDICTED: ankyrin repeat, SAM and basic leucine zipper domain-containing protein 1-like [Saccoglossus kowalevskii]